MVQLNLNQWTNLQSPNIFLKIPVLVQAVGSSEISYVLAIVVL